MKKKSKKKAATLAKAPVNAGTKKVGKQSGKRIGAVSWPQSGRRPGKVDAPVSRLAEALKSAREEKGITLTQIARKLDVAPATLIKFEERGQGISVGIVSQFAAAVGCELQVKPVKSTSKKKR